MLGRTRRGFGACFTSFNMYGRNGILVIVKEVLHVCAVEGAVCGREGVVDIGVQLALVLSEVKIVCLVALVCIASCFLLLGFTCPFSLLGLSAVSLRQLLSELPKV